MIGTDAGTFIGTNEGILQFIDGELMPTEALSGNHNSMVWEPPYLWSSYTARPQGAVLRYNVETGENVTYELPVTDYARPSVHCTARVDGRLYCAVNLGPAGPAAIYRQEGDSWEQVARVRANVREVLADGDNLVIAMYQNNFPIAVLHGGTLQEIEMRGIARGHTLSDAGDFIQVSVEPNNATIFDNCQLLWLERTTYNVHRMRAIHDTETISTPKTVLTDSSGVEWAATDIGLVRFDGSSYHTYNTAEGIIGGLRGLALRPDGKIIAYNARRFVIFDPLAYHYRPRTISWVRTLLLLLGIAGALVFNDVATTWRWRIKLKRRCSERQQTLWKLIQSDFPAVSIMKTCEISKPTYHRELKEIIERMGFDSDDVTKSTQLLLARTRYRLIPLFFFKTFPSPPAGHTDDSNTDAS